MEKKRKFQPWTVRRSEETSLGNHVDRNKIIFLVLLLVLPLIYISGYITQFFVNHAVWQAAGGIPGDGTAPKMPDSSIFICILSVFSSEGLKVLAVICAVISILIFSLVYRDKGFSRNYDKEANFYYSDKGTYGTARFEDPRNLIEFLDVGGVKDTTGIILGTHNREIVALRPDSRLNRNIAVFGASGSMKSRAFVRNMIFQTARRGESMILTDPKNEIYDDMAQYLIDQGYRVKVFNLIKPMHSDRWNFLEDVGCDELMVQISADVIMKNTTDGRPDHFWDSAEMNLLKALILYVNYEKEPEHQNMGEVYSMLSELTKEELDARFDMLPRGHPAKLPYNIFKRAGDKVNGGMIVGLGSRLQVYQSRLICDVTAKDDFDLILPGTEKCAYFCITSDQHSAFDFLSSLFFSFLFIKLVDYADAEGNNGALPVPVNFILDEMPNIGSIPDFKKKISTVRSRNISLSVIFQNLAQLKNRYPHDEWQEILGSCDTQIALGCTDQMTAEFISDRMGETTVEVSSESKQLDTLRVSDYTPEYKETSSVGRRKLRTMNEVMRLPHEDAIVILRGQNVFRVKKFDYKKHPESRKLKRSRIKYYIPQWYNQETDYVYRPKRQADKKKELKKEKAKPAEVPIEKKFNIRTKDDVMN